MIYIARQQFKVLLCSVTSANFFTKNNICRFLVHYLSHKLTLLDTGDIVPCCHLQEHKLGNIENTRLQDIWNSPKLMSLRKEHLNKTPSICSKQIESKNCHKWNDDLWPVVEKKIFQKRPIRKLDIRLNGQCNLQCLMCDVWKRPQGPYTEENFWDYARENIFPHLLEVDVLGGEPFVQKDTFKLIDEISRLNQNCEWMFTTNAQWNWTNELEKKLRKINIYQISLSVDAFSPSLFEEIRVGGKFALWLKNFHQFLKLREEFSFELSLEMAVGRYNINEVPQLRRWALLYGCDYYYLPIKNPKKYELSLEQKKWVEGYYQLTHDEKLKCLWSQEELSY